jgi:hypothetical protein
MSIVQTIPADQAADKVAEIYVQIDQNFSRVNPGFQLQSASPVL